MDLWVPQVQELLKWFDFLPPLRLADIMVSFACPVGSVGPHLDQYDVFLLQVEGQRRWQIGPTCTPQTPLLTDPVLRIVANFSAQQEWVLGPGDMLYLPPGGFALGRCTERVSDLLHWLPLAQHCRHAG